MVGVDYEEKFPYSLINPKKVTVMVDFSVDIEGMFHILNNSKEFIWIDHHKTAIDAARAKGLHNMVHGIQEVGVAGCELTWQYVNPGDIIPPAVHHLGRYDVFSFTKGSDVLPFQYGMRSLLTDPSQKESEHLWNTLFQPTLEGDQMLEFIVQDGKTILRYLKADQAKVAKRFAYRGEFDDIPALCINHAPGGSMIFNSIWEKNCPLMVAYGQLPDKRWIVHLYSNDSNIDCGALAREHGGGGHRGAAGYVTDRRPPFTFPPMG
jgi:hypothetical protein